MYRSFGEILARKRILVCVGSGGVGKTTTAAALALEAARRGMRTLVLTIDPARRLANSLGLTALGHEIQEVPAELIDRAGPRHQPGGTLFAMMLDQKRAFDELVARYASDPQAVGRILANPVYKQISGSLAGSQEYAAMAKLQEFDETGEWELIVVDTPPTAHALDFLDAPEKLTQAIDSPAIEWFRKLRGQGRGKSGWSVVGKAGQYLLERLAKFVGNQFLDDLALFFTEFNDILGGFRHRAEATFSLLRQDKIGFVLVASPEPMALNEACYFYERLIGASMPFAGFVINKMHDDRPLAASREDIEAKVAAVPAVAELGFQPTTIRMATEALLAAHAELQVLATADQDAIERLGGVAGADALVVTVPYFRQDIHQVTQLGRLGRYLVG